MGLKHVYLWNKVIKFFAIFILYMYLQIFCDTRAAFGYCSLIPINIYNIRFWIKFNTIWVWILHCLYVFILLVGIPHRHVFVCMDCNVNYALNLKSMSIYKFIFWLQKKTKSKNQETQRKQKNLLKIKPESVLNQYWICFNTKKT